MLTEATLKEAIQTADKSAAVCGRFCRVGASIEDGTYRCFHNGLGPSDSDDTVVWATETLALGQEPLAKILGTWLEHLHQRGPQFDLNTRKERA